MQTNSGKDVLPVLELARTLIESPGTWNPHGARAQAASPAQTARTHPWDPEAVTRDALSAVWFAADTLARQAFMRSSQYRDPDRFSPSSDTVCHNVCRSWLDPAAASMKPERVAYGIVMAQLEPNGGQAYVLAIFDRAIEMARSEDRSPKPADEQGAQAA